MEPGKLILLTSRPEDLKFWTEAARRAGLAVSIPMTDGELLNQLRESPTNFLVWDLERESGPSPRLIATDPEILVSLEMTANPFRVIAVSEQSFTEFPQLRLGSGDSRRLPYHHWVRRRYPAGALEICGALLTGMARATLPDFASCFEEDAKFQTISIQASEKRRAAVEAMQSFMGKAGLENRIAAKVAQASDELLMNAIFDAARDKDGKHFRQLLDRRAKFAFMPGEKVELTVGMGKDFLGIRVVDRYGSVDAIRVWGFLAQDYKDTDYQIRKYGPGAGLGLYGVVQGGLSLWIASAAGKRTEAAVFIPRTRSMREFKQSFHFATCAGFGLPVDAMS